ncbi:G-type lectin S-receptor-like serine/threonine-protein kinase, partial [Tanacetum coccineum]
MNHKRVRLERTVTSVARYHSPPWTRDWIRLTEIGKHGYGRWLGFGGSEMVVWGFGGRFAPQLHESAGGLPSLKLSLHSCSLSGSTCQEHKAYGIETSIAHSDCTAVDTISANQEIKDGETIISEGKMFEMGFFSPGNSTNRYLGIWYKKISSGTVVWVANRETPITDKSGMFQVSKLGVVLILKGDNSTVWSSNSMVLMNYNHVVVVQLLDNGNLVVWHQNSTNQYLIWQSFDYPGDTLLPGMKFGKNLVTGIEWNSTSWKSPDDPSIGLYSSILDTNGYPQIFRREGRNTIARLGPWNGLRFSGSPVDIPNSVFSTEFVVNQKEIYYKYELRDIEGDSCARFKLCGPYGSCSMNKHPLCSCMEGFEQKFPQEWAASDWTNGCQRKKPLNCRSEYGFKKVSGVKLPDTRKYQKWWNWMFAMVDELMDIKEFDGDDNIYIRMAASEIA